jgi:hypothetical protein
MVVTRGQASAHVWRRAMNEFNAAVKAAIWCPRIE